MKRKIFISINIPERAKKELTKTIEKWSDLPVKWVKEANFHITLFFLGYIDDETTKDVCEKVKIAAQEENIFDLEFDRIELAPEKDDPKMIWLTGAPSEELKNLYEKIEKELDIFRAPKKSFRPHITLGRIRKHKWEDLTEKPEISEKFSLFVTAETVDIMASGFGEGESEYALIESCPLK
ncbi:MAG TPA: RNA 2',3'-cyclic phosphodiesterase [Candidatus Moranbacteria bacterium]|nr:RNA 2',3'-cyclic phosphodiesterase [Candidatus Moranbacteria bacterium]